MKILITGAAGHVAKLAIPGIVEGNNLRLTDIHHPEQLPSGATFIQADLLEASADKFKSLFEDIEIVVHSAYVPSGERDVYSLLPPQIDRFDAELKNVIAAQRIYRSAYDAGVRRVVIVSSNHAADWYEHAEIHARVRDMVFPTDYPLADNFYGWAKASYELLAYPYACGTFGRRMEVVSLRIGSPYPINMAQYETASKVPESSLNKPVGIAGFKRALGAYLSDRDCASLFRSAVDRKQIAGANGVPWSVAYGISDNTRAFWSLDSARRDLGYAPQDDSEVIYSADIARILSGSNASGRLG